MCRRQVAEQVAHFAIGNVSGNHCIATERTSRTIRFTHTDILELRAQLPKPLPNALKNPVALSTHGRTRPRARERTLPYAVDSLANTFAVNGPAGWGKTGRCLKLLAPGTTRAARASMCSCDIRTHRKPSCIPRMPEGELLRGIALACALCRGDGNRLRALGSAHYNENCITNVKSMTYGPCFFQAYVCIRTRLDTRLERSGGWRAFQLHHVALRIKQINGRAFALGAVAIADLAHPDLVRLQMGQDGRFVVIGHAQA